jgi:hypothetical protein
VSTKPRILERHKGLTRVLLERVVGKWTDEDAQFFAEKLATLEAAATERALADVLSACLSDGITFEDDEVKALRRKLGLR